MTQRIQVNTQTFTFFWDTHTQSSFFFAVTKKKSSPASYLPNDQYVFVFLYICRFLPCLKQTKILFRYTRVSITTEYRLDFISNHCHSAESEDKIRCTFIYPRGEIQELKQQQWGWNTGPYRITQGKKKKRSVILW